MPGGTAPANGGGEVTTAELSRGVARIEHSLDVLTAQVTELSSGVSALRGDLGRTQAVLDLREAHQTERTAGRDRQMADVSKRLGDLEQLRWKVVGAFGALTILGSGTAAAVVRIIG